MDFSSSAHRYIRFLGRMTSLLAVLIVATCAALTGLVYFYPSAYDGSSADCAIVLGAAVWDEKPSPVYRERLAFAVALYKTGKVKYVIATGGVGAGDKLSEGEVGRDYFLENGVPLGSVAFEAVSRTTLQNMKNTKPMLFERAIKSCLIVSDPLHLKRAMVMANGLGIPARPAATPTTMYRSLRPRTELLLSEAYYLFWYYAAGI